MVTMYDVRMVVPLMKNAKPRFFIWLTLYVASV